MSFRLPLGMGSLKSCIDCLQEVQNKKAKF